MTATTAAMALLATTAIGVAPALAQHSTPTTVRAAVPDNPEDKFSAEALDELTDQKAADFWIRLADKADLSGAERIADWDERGWYVYDTLRATAKESQASVIKMLDAAGANYKSYWINNSIYVEDGTLALAENVALSSAVTGIYQTFEMKETEPLDSKPAGPKTTAAVEWGLEAINAPDVWNIGFTGEGITVASFDTGVDVTHPALRSKYRGTNADGSFSHDYNWFDIPNACGGQPCPAAGSHGTHTTGTMLGEDGANQIGVAPGAKWIAANCIDLGGCDFDDYLADAQWFLAPTRVDGSDADPAMRPHIINNSWGIPPGVNLPEDWMSAETMAWNASGIFGAWAAGNEGPSCGTNRFPGEFQHTYATGAFDVNGNIASFSSRGPGREGDIKPNIAAPGVNVRSSIPGGYGTSSGTSMAAPHLAGTVALLWSAAPALERNIEGTVALLNETAIDTSDLSCGGTAEDNNVWGEGKLDALALVEAAPTVGVGTATGIVTDASGTPLAGASVAFDGPFQRTTTTGTDGTFSVVVPVGDYTATASLFGYLPSTSGTFTVAEDQTVTVPAFELETAPSYDVTGTVTIDGTGEPVAGAPVSLGSHFDPTTTAADGTFTFADVPVGTYPLTVTMGGCAASFSDDVTVTDGDVNVPVSITPNVDAEGYSCSVTAGTYLQGDTQVSLSGDDASAAVQLPITFPYYGGTYTNAYISTNGVVNFLGANAAYSNVSIPNGTLPNAAIYAYWDDLSVDASASVWTGSTTVNGQDAFVIEWRNIRPLGDAAQRMSFSVTLVEDGTIITGYGDMASGVRGASATTGIENATGTIALEYSFNEAVLEPNTLVTYTPPPYSFVAGTVTDANDHEAISGATVTATQGNGDVATAKTRADGSYLMVVDAGDVSVEATATNYVSESESFDAVEGETHTYSPDLATGRAEVSVEDIEYVLDGDDQRTAEVTVKNTGSADLDIEVSESAAAAAAEESGTPAGASHERPKITEENANALTAEGLRPAPAKEAADAADVGDILAQWQSGLSLNWGTGFDGDVWISDPNPPVANSSFTPAGQRLETYPANWGGTWAGDMAFDTTQGLMCQVNVGGDNGIKCFDTDTGALVSTLTGSPWSGISQRGLAYNPDDDVFYIGGWNEGVVYTVAGTTHATPGATLDECEPADPGIAGLSYNPTSGNLWVAPNSAGNQLMAINPADCSTIRTVAFPGGGDFSGAGLEMDSAGALWVNNQVNLTTYLVDVGDPHSTDVSWLDVSTETLSLAPGEEATFTVDVDTAGLEPGVYGASVRLDMTAGRQPRTAIGVNVVVSAYQIGVNSAGGAYTDHSLFEWAGDGYFTGGSTATIKGGIGGTEDDSLYQSYRTGTFTYTFPDAPAGTYVVDFGFAEPKKNAKRGEHLFDVKANGQYVLVAQDVAAEVGSLTALDKSVTIEHAGGDLVVEFVARRSFGNPMVSTLKVTERPDL